MDNGRMTLWQNSLPRGHIPSAQQSPRAPNVGRARRFFFPSLLHLSSEIFTITSLPPHPQPAAAFFFCFFRFSEFSRQQFLEIFVLELLLRPHKFRFCTIPAGVPVTKDHQGVEQSVKWNAPNETYSVGVYLYLPINFTAFNVTRGGEKRTQLHRALTRLCCTASCSPNTWHASHPQAHAHLNGNGPAFFLHL